MKRFVVFILLGPLLGLCAEMLAMVMAGHRPSLNDLEGPVLVLGFSFMVSTVTGLADEALSHVIPPVIRVPLAALCGAAIVAGMMMSFAGKYVPLSSLQSPLIGAAICMGLCSWLSSEKRS